MHVIRSRWFTVALLIVQVAVLWLSLNFGTFSLFCTGTSRFVPTAHVPSAYAFGVLHLLLGGLFFLGLVSLSVPRLRLIYVVSAILSMGLLPVQAALVEAGMLTCEGP